MGKFTVAWAATMALAATPAAAIGYYDVTITGLLTAQIQEGVNTSFDLGDVFTLTTRFTDERILQPYNSLSTPIPGATEYTLYGLPEAGREFWRIEGGGVLWRSQYDFLDGLFGMPTMQIKDGAVVGMLGYLYPTNSTIVPIIALDGATNGFRIDKANGAYLNFADFGRWKGVWDFENASVVYTEGFLAIPEPETWGLMLLGFGVTGALVRRRRHQFARA